MCFSTLDYPIAVVFSQLFVTEVTVFYRDGTALTLDYFLGDDELTHDMVVWQRSTRTPDRQSKRARFDVYKM